MSASSKVWSFYKRNINQTVCSYIVCIPGCAVIGTLFASLLFTHTFTHLILHLEQIPSSLDSQMFPLGDSKYPICGVQKSGVCTIPV